MGEQIPARLTELIRDYFPGWTAVEPIGEGSYSRVFHIRQQDGVSSDAALKWVTFTRDSRGIAEILARGATEKDVRAYLALARKNLEREIQALDRLRGNSHIVNMDDYHVVDREDGSFDLLIRMECLTPLPALLDGMTVEDVRRMGMDICSALADCEREGIVHRDIKPANIFRNRQGRYKLGDFGVARVWPTQKDIVPQGTPLYMAPEVYRAEEGDHRRVDTYSLGLVLYELLNLRHPPFTPLYSRLPTVEEETEAVAQRMTGRDLPSPAQGTPEMNLMILRACSFDPEDRYDSAGEMLEELREMDLRDAGGEALRALSSLPPPPPEEKKPPERDPGQDSKRTEKASPRDTNPLSLDRRDAGTRGAAPAGKRPARTEAESPAREESEEAPKGGQREPDFRVQDVIDRESVAKTQRQEKKKKRKRMLIIALVALLLIAGVVLFLVLHSRVSAPSLTQKGMEAEVTWSGGFGPWQVSAARDGKVFYSAELRERQTRLELAPGFKYQLQVSGQTAEAEMAELPPYAGGALELQRVKLQCYLVQAGGGVGRLNDVSTVSYDPQIGKDGARGYQLRLVYRMSGEEDREVCCFLLGEGYQATQRAVLRPSEFPAFCDLSLNEALLAIGQGNSKLIYKVYLEGCLLAEGTIPISNE